MSLGSLAMSPTTSIRIRRSEGCSLMNVATLVVTWSAIFATASRCAGSAPRPVRGEAGRGVTNYFDLRGKISASERV